MHRKLLLTFATLLIIVLGCSGLLAAWFHGAFGGEFERELPNGYRVFCSNASTIAILAPDGTKGSGFYGPPIVVAPLVDRVAVVGAIIVGYVKESPNSELGSDQAPGYFIVDTIKNVALVRLTEDQLKQEFLRSTGRKALPWMWNPRHLVR